MKEIISKQISAYTFNDLPSMIEKAFLLTDHEAGPFGFKMKDYVIGYDKTKYLMFIYSTNAGYSDKIKEYYDLYVTYLPQETTPFFKRKVEIDINVNKVFMHDGSQKMIGSKLFTFNQSDLNQIPYQIVKATYEIIDNHGSEQPFHDLYESTNEGEQQSA